MLIEVHILQNYALSNLNRDDTGAPKTCEFGAVRRARISSQCLKRAMRSYVRESELVPSDRLSYRTKLLLGSLVDRLEVAGLTSSQASELAAATIRSLGLKLEGEKTQYLLLVGEREIDALARTALTHQDTLLKGGGKNTAKEAKAARDELLAVLDGGGAVDLALFGRMIADRPEKNVDAAAQVAHAISTHAVGTEFDFYSAVDDLQSQDSDEGTGAGMLGMTLYNSACYYRYANLDVSQLATNLKGRHDHVASAARCFAVSMIRSIPTGKQTATAAHNLPAVVFAVVREDGLCSLANAFVPAVTVRATEDLVAKSARAMFDHYSRLGTMYGSDGVQYAGVATYLDGLECPSGVEVTENVSTLVERLMEQLSVSIAE